MLARFAFITRPYKDGLGLFVTRSKMPMRRRRMNSPLRRETAVPVGCAKLAAPHERKDRECALSVLLRSRQVDGLDRHEPKRGVLQVAARWPGAVGIASRS